VKASGWQFQTHYMLSQSRLFENKNSNWEDFSILFYEYTTSAKGVESIACRPNVAYGQISHGPQLWLSHAVVGMLCQSLALAFHHFTHKLLLTIYRI